MSMSMAKSFARKKTWSDIGDERFVIHSIFWGVSFGLFLLVQLRGKWVGEWRMSKGMEKMLQRMIAPNADLRCNAVDVLGDSYWNEHVKSIAVSHRPSFPTLLFRPRANIVFVIQNVQQVPRTHHRHPSFWTRRSPSSWTLASHCHLSPPPRPRRAGKIRRTSRRSPRKTRSRK